MMRPVIFNYALDQRPGDFEKITYSYEDDVSELDGTSLVERSRAQLPRMTKMDTDTDRDSDDGSNRIALGVMTKTDVARESDDSSYDEVYGSLTKTRVERESDDDSFEALTNNAIKIATGRDTLGADRDLIEMLLTKTKTTRESDE